MPKQNRLPTPEVKIGKVLVGYGDPTANENAHKPHGNPIVIQSMTNTNTADAQATAAQCIALAEAGSEIIRMTVNNNLAAPKVPEIRRILDSKGYEDLPLIGDFHYNGHILLEEFPEMARTLDKYRINPGNVGFGDKHEYNFEKIIRIAIENDKPVRIGVNWGSLDQDLFTKMMEENGKRGSGGEKDEDGRPLEPKSDKEVIIDAMVESAIRSAELAEKIGLAQNKIILSVKMSIVQDMVAAYEQLAERMKKNNHLYALHLGLTEAGVGLQGAVSSSAALGILLQQGIGDTIRVSLTPTPDRPRTDEVEVCKQLLQSMGFRYFKPQVTSCPGCGRTDSTFFQELADEVNKAIEARMPEWKKHYPCVAEMQVAVMGCVVNGPGESKHADIAISLPGRSEKPVAPVYLRGSFYKSLTGDGILEEFMGILEEFVVEEYGE